jgi:dienelactone hydrolase
VAAQPGDISFVLDSVLGTGGDQAAVATVAGLLGGNDDRPLSERIDADRIGLGGHSLGGATTYGVAFNTCCRDARVKAAEVLSGAELPVGVPPGGTFELDGQVPLLIVHGDHDGAFAFDLPRGVFAAAAPPVWFVTLVGGTHSAPYENDPSPWDEVATAITTGFWDATIGQVPGARERFEAAASTPGLTSLQEKAPEPAPTTPG